MKVTRDELAARAEKRQSDRQAARTASRNTELALLLAGAVLAGTGLYLVYAAKTGAAGLNAQTIDLNRLTGSQQLIPFLGALPSDADQSYVANRIYDHMRHGERFNNTGAIARMRVTEPEIARMRSLVGLRQRMEDARIRRDNRQQEEEEDRGWLSSRWARLIGRDKPKEISIRLLTPAQFTDLKPHLRVREPGAFRNQVILWSALFLAAFLVVHAFWRWRAFGGDNWLLPILMVLCGIGMILMISLRDPLRDTLLFGEFAQGVIAGCFAIALFSVPDYERSFSRLSYVPLLLSLLLAIALGLFGNGPGGSDAKVNLFFFQPVELIRILIVLFLAGYFAQNWDALRQLKQDQSLLPSWARRFNLPRLDYVLPVMTGVLASLALFFWLSDLGPALIIGCLFLTMYSIARNNLLLAAAGLAVILLGFAGGYAVGHPRTVGDRVSMWLSPWDNGVRGGDQVADSLWSLSTGAATGTGLGLGDPQLVPAAHTDLIVSALGEQLGFVGIAAVYLLYAIIIYRGIRIARNAPGIYSFFLVIGLTLISAYQILLITGGLLGLIPLSGVVSPFLSYGRTSMVANFALVGIILAVSAAPKKRDQYTNFGAGGRVLTAGLAAMLLVVLGRFAWVQIARADQILVRGSLTVQADGARRYQYNPRLLAIARDLPKGTIYDRNGLPLAANDWSTIESHRAEYSALGVNLDQAAAKLDKRQYPLGSSMFYLLGDARTRAKQGATNTAFQERASRVRLQGYDDVVQVEEGRDSVTGQSTTRIKRDYRALIPLLRHRYEPNDPAVKEVMERPKDVRMSIDAALQLRASEILKQHLLKLGKTKGALVVIDPATGDLLAAVSYPWPSEGQFATLKADAEAPLPSEDMLDRARFGLYPPGSSFKIVTAMAALRKDPALAQKRYDCVRLPDGRIGNVVWKRAIRDDVKDTQPHGSVDLQKGIAVSCNAFFAQLGAESVGAPMLFDTASRLGISVAQPNTPEKLQQYLPQASYGQGQVVASPFQMARVAATIANGGNAPQGRWVIDETNPRVRTPLEVLPESLAKQIAADMRGVVTSGTGRVLSGSPIPIAGKTGTAELAKGASHAWFIGFAPYGAKPGKQIAFAVLVENGQYGGTSAAPIAGEIVAAAHKLGII
jgi:cell division protein FtsI/penicillin-binding protein 2/cell division protein FtsW (lipid II flippase)